MLSIKNCSRIFGPAFLKQLRSSSLAESVFRASSGGALCQACQQYSTEQCKKVYTEQLKGRGIIQVTGKDAPAFLQGLITNDMNCMDCHDCRSLYAMVLNAQGRVLYDIIIYNNSSGIELDNFLIECDAQVTQELVSLFKKYKLRRKVTLQDASDTYKLWTFYRPAEYASKVEPSLKLEFKDSSQIATYASDPRLRSFGWRCISTGSVEGHSVEPAPEDSSYDIERFKLGIAEGIVDLPPGKALPLENNLEYLHGVSFSKGCYIGQELTARTHHTGVTRKRLMPLTLEKTCDITSGTNIVKSTGKSAGVLRNTVGKYGLGIVRLLEVKNELFVATESGNKVTVQPHQPAWWPKEESEQSSTN